VAHHVHRMTSLPADGCGRGSQTSHAMRNQIANGRRQRDRLKTRLPVGQIGKSLSSPFCKNISVHFSPKSLLHLLPSRTRKRGVSRSSRTLGAGCDGRGSVRRANSAPDEWHCCGRRSRVVLTPRRWRQVLEKQSFLRARVATKPGHPGEHEGNR
jgi:hypothetical protein